MMKRPVEHEAAQLAAAVDYESIVQVVRRVNQAVALQVSRPSGVAAQSVVQAATVGRPCAVKQGQNRRGNAI
jgi:hypothetical protein